MNPRAFMYGETRRATVNYVLPSNDPLCPRCVVVIDDNHEAYVMTFTHHDIAPATHNTVEITFVDGGPFNGHWKITKLL